MKLVLISPKEPLYRHHPRLRGHARLRPRLRLLRGAVRVGLAMNLPANREEAMRFGQALGAAEA